jgi:putative permease
MIAKKAIFSILFLTIIIFFLILLKEVAFLIALSCLIAYVLGPIIDKLSAKIKCKGASIALVFSLFWGIIVLVLMFLVPTIYEQFALFISKIPKYKLYIQDHLLPYIVERTNNIDSQSLKKISDFVEFSANQVFNLTFSILTNIWEYTVKTIHIMIFLILLPIFSFYFIKDKEHFKQYISKFTNALDSNIVQFIVDCSKLILQFIKGQINVCIIMSCYYTLALTLLQLDFSLLLGIFSGFALAIPFVGILTALSLSSIITIFYFGIDIHLLHTVSIYLIGQILEGYIITPKIVGDKIGLHPLLIILSLLCWGNLFGILGLFIAIPMACILKTLFRNILVYL